MLRAAAFIGRPDTTDRWTCPPHHLTSICFSIWLHLKLMWIPCKKTNNWLMLIEWIIVLNNQNYGIFCLNQAAQVQIWASGKVHDYTDGPAGCSQIDYQTNITNINVGVFHWILHLKLRFNRFVCASVSHLRSRWKLPLFLSAKALVIQATLMTTTKKKSESPSQRSVQRSLLSSRYQPR